MAKDRRGQAIRPGVAVALVDQIPGATEQNEAAINMRLREIDADARKAGFSAEFINIRFGGGTYIITYQLESSPYYAKEK